MSSVRELHNEATRLAQLAMVARHEGDLDRAEALARRAYEYEVQAADLIPYDESSEPTRSILYLSAASLAYQCKELHAAQRLIAKGLSGYPPPRTEQDLKDLYEQVKFEYHLQERDIVLEDEDLQLSMQGEAVGFGIILYKDFIHRIQSIRSLIDRTVQRLMRRTYQRSGRVAQMYRPFIPALAAPTEGSFVITFKLVRAKDQPIPLFFDAAQVIDELLVGVEFINDGDEEGLREHVREEAYFTHFLSTTRHIAPDGDRINLVGFTGARRSVTLTRPRREIELLVQPEIAEREVERTPIRVTGLLDYATSRREERIGLTTEDVTEYTVSVLEGLDDLVRSFFGQWVTVIGTYDGTLIYLTDIQSGDE